MSVAIKLINFKINATYFVKNHEILLKYFNELKAQTLWKHTFLYVQRLYFIFWRTSYCFKHWLRLKDLQKKQKYSVLFP